MIRNLVITFMLLVGVVYLIASWYIILAVAVISVLYSLVTIHSKIKDEYNKL